MRSYLPSRRACLILLSFVQIMCVAAFAGTVESSLGGGKRVTALSPEEEKRAEATKTRVYARLHEDDKAGFVKLGPPKAGEWLACHKEFPQTVERYSAIDVRSRPTKERRAIVLQPLGKFNRVQRKRLETLREYAQLFFQLPTRLAEPMELELNDSARELIRKVPLGNRHGDYYRQFNASVILNQILAKRVPDDAVLYMGVTCEDLWAGKLNYLFGLGSFKHPVAVMSVCRFDPEFFGRTRKVEDDVWILRRQLKILNHEACHVFGLHHCVFYHCTMNGCNCLGEMDRAPIHLCPVCHRKLKWSHRWDSAKRYGELRDFYRKHGLERASAWLDERSRNWHAIEQRESSAREGEGEEE